jgi:hypothetical protein
VNPTGTTKSSPDPVMPLWTRCATVQEMPYDVFVSYAPADQVWVHMLVKDLETAGVRVFLDRWEITPGDILVHRIEAG